MNVTMINRKYTIENCQQYVGQIIWYLEILNVFYKETKNVLKYTPLVVVSDAAK